MGDAVPFCYFLRDRSHHFTGRCTDGTGLAAFRGFPDAGDLAISVPATTRGAGFDDACFSALADVAVSILRAAGFESFATPLALAAFGVRVPAPTFACPLVSRD